MRQHPQAALAPFALGAAALAALAGGLALGLWVTPGASALPVRHAEESMAGQWAPLRQTVDELAARVATRKPRFDRLPRDGDLHYECATLPGIPPTSLCLFNMRLLMNAALARVSYYSENDKRVLTDTEMLEEVKNSNALGFNVASPVVADFERRREAAREFRATRPSGGAVESITSAEQVFFTTEETFEEAVLAPLARTSPPAYLITATADDDLDVLLGHEIQHAQFFHDAQFRDVVERYWCDAVTAAEKDSFKAAIAHAYDVENPRVVVDEFQAYVFMDTPTVSALVPLAERHRASLRRAVEDAGIAPYRDAFAPWSPRAGARPALGSDVGVDGQVDPGLSPGASPLGSDPS